MLFFFFLHGLQVQLPRALLGLGVLEFPSPSDLLRTAC